MQDTIYKVYFQPAFLICAAVLAIAGSGMSIAIKSFGVYLKKEPLPLKKTLDDLDEKALAPYKVITKEKIENEDIVKSLGTKYYIQWVLEDNNTPANNAVRKCSLLITYYEVPDVVVHVPEECYIGAGCQLLENYSITFKVKKGVREEKIPGRYLLFRHPETDRKFPDLYLFYVNGIYTNSREKARAILFKNVFGRHSYYSKVELVFDRSLVLPTKEQTVKASEKLLAVILPVLERDHWPDLEKLK